MATHNRHRRPSSGGVQHKAASVAVTAGIGLAAPLVLSGTASAAPNSAGAWDKIAECESNGRWNLPYGHASSTGGLQIQLPTWREYGGLKYAPQPHLASKDQQIAVAEQILKGQGPRAWTCNAKTGYPLNGLVGKTGGKAPAPSKPPAASKPPAPTKPAAPSKPPAPAKPPAAKEQGSGSGSSGTYAVRSGDTLQGISVRHGGDGGAGDWRALYEANKPVIGADPDVILPGQVLKVPGKATAPAPQRQGAKPAPRPVPTSEARQESPRPQPQGPKSSRVKPVANAEGRNFGTASAGYSAGYHTGSDFAAPHGSRVKAAAGGTVIASDSSPSYGVNVRIKHADGTYTLYAHLSGKSVQPGAQVQAGQLIGYVGSTGNSTGPHLHFEVRTQPEYRKGGFLDPVAWLKKTAA
ncbi:peptidoglycan DD-metalloendopeptidase family protein [Streptomyces sp. NPDC001594]|uniref:peptidoglycan DD-metalloendopeptidase family protein n=1 Tax=Streptomyces sp. NPDC001594 TaxID=3364590 RepID=UPI0036C71F39